METAFIISVGDCEPEELERFFLRNVRSAETLYAEFYKKKHATLRSRLESLFAVLPEEIANPITDDRDGLIAEIVLTRNYLVHGDRRLRASAARGDRLITLTTKLGALLLSSNSILRHQLEDFQMMVHVLKISCEPHLSKSDQAARKGLARHLRNPM